jgi:hypothetical protein
MKSHFTVPELIQSVAAQMRAALCENLIPHPGELGTGREEVLRQFLEKYLPQRYGVSTGFVFDSSGKVSKQIDVIIYDALLAPKFEAVGGKVFHPCESVVCVGEVKSVLTSNKDFNGALENLRSVKELDRSGRGVNESIRTGEVINQSSNHLDQIFSFLFVIDRCMKEERLREAWLKHLCANERHLWPNLFFYFDHYLITHCCKYGVCPNPMDSTGISSITDRPKDELLLRFYRHVSLAVGVTNVSRFSFLAYLDREGSYGGDVYPYESAPAAIVEDMPPHMRPVYGLLDKL